MKLDDFTGRIRGRGEKALVPFFTAGYPDEETFLRLVRGASRAGCRVIEIGIPFSDPLADGPVIQASSQQALDQGMTLKRALALTREAVSDTGAALVLMGYMNPVLQMGMETFAHRAGEAGVSGVIVPDLPFEESTEVREIFGGEGITLVDLVARNSSAQRVKKITGEAKGFVYLVSLTGVTGARTTLPDLEGFVERVRGFTDRPLYVGFGISTEELAVHAVRHADGVIIGSALIKGIQGCRSAEEAVEKTENFLTRFNRAVNLSIGSRK